MAVRVIDGALLAAQDGEVGKQSKQTTYLEGREKRNRRRSVDRIEGQGKNQRRGQAGHSKKRPVESFADSRTSSSSYPAK